MQSDRAGAGAFDGVDNFHDVAVPQCPWRFNKYSLLDALVFWNLTPAGEPDYRTAHIGTAPTRGEKWLFSQWIRIPLAGVRAGR